MSDGVEATPGDPLALAREAFRDLAADRREAERELAACRDQRKAAALAAVDAVQLLAEATEAYGEALDPGTLEGLRLSVVAAWEKLEASGVVREGAPGEPVDRTRHRVVKTVPAAGRPAGVVAEVVAPGVRVQGELLREAVVVATRGE